MCEVQPYRYVIIQKIWNAFICESCTLRLWSQVLYTIKAHMEAVSTKQKAKQGNVEILFGAVLQILGYSEDVHHENLVTFLGTPQKSCGGV